MSSWQGRGPNAGPLAECMAVSSMQGRDVNAGPMWGAACSGVLKRKFGLSGHPVKFGPLYAGGGASQTVQRTPNCVLHGF